MGIKEDFEAYYRGDGRRGRGGLARGSDFDTAQEAADYVVALPQEQIIIHFLLAQPLSGAEIYTALKKAHFRNDISGRGSRRIDEGKKRGFIVKTDVVAKNPDGGWGYRWRMTAPAIIVAQWMGLTPIPFDSGWDTEIRPPKKKGS